MIKLEKRLSALEAQYQADADKAATSEYENALRRVLKALRDALPGDVLHSVPSPDGLSMRVVCDRNAKSHAEYLAQCHDRITLGLATDDDRRVLASVPTDDLEFIGRTAEQVIAESVELDRAY